MARKKLSQYFAEKSALLVGVSLTAVAVISFVVWIALSSEAPAKSIFHSVSVNTYESLDTIGDTEIVEVVGGDEDPRVLEQVLKSAHIRHLTIRAYYDFAHVNFAVTPESQLETLTFESSGRGGRPRW